MVTAQPLSAASQIDFSGYYRVQAYAYSGWWNTSGGDGANDISERMVRNRLRMNIVFRPTDQIDIKWRIHGPHNARWGRANADYSLTTRYIYGVVKTEYGNISLGRISTDLDSAGLQTLGYVPYYSFGMQGAIFDTDFEKTGIMFRKDWENWGLKAFYIKETSLGADSDNYGSDQDYDRFSIEPYYKWDKGGASLALQYDRNMGRNQSPSTNPPKREAYYDTNYHFTVNPALTHTWDIGDQKSLALNLEGKFAWGERKNGPGSVDSTNNPDTKKKNVDGAGVYADLTFNYGGGNVALGGWWMDGSADGSGRHDLVTTGTGFYPFTVFHSPYAFPQPGGTADNIMEGHDSSNHWALTIMGSHSLTPEVSLSYALGHFSKNKTRKGVSKDMGTEADLGLTVQLLDNLQFTTKAGYFFTGDYYKEEHNRRDYDKNVFSWGNELIFNF